MQTHEMHGGPGHDGLDPADLRARGRTELTGYGVQVVTLEVHAAEALGAAMRVTCPRRTSGANGSCRPPRTRAGGQCPIIESRVVGLDSHDGRLRLVRPRDGQTLDRDAVFF